MFPWTRGKERRKIVKGHHRKRRKEEVVIIARTSRDSIILPLCDKTVEHRPTSTQQSAEDIEGKG